MNIAIVIPTVKAGGAEKQAVLLASCLSTTHKLWFIVFSGEEPREQKHLDALNFAGVELVTLEGPVIKKIRELTALMRKFNIEVAFNYLTMCDGAACYAEHKAGVKYIFNGIRCTHFPFWKELIERFCNNHWATGTIVNSHRAELSFSGRGFDKNKLIVIPNCFPSIAPFMERTDRETITVTTVGRFDPVKDYETSIKTIASTYAKTRNIRYRIVGYGAMEQKIRQWVVQYGIQDITDILINPSNIPELLRDSDVFLTTSLYEGTSNAVMEALNASLPVVCTKVGDNNYLVKDGQSGFVRNVGDVKALSESLLKLVGDYNLRQSFGKAANQNLRDNYSMETFARRYGEILKQCL